MDKRRIIIADVDVDYVDLLQLKFAETFYGKKVSIEIITEKTYFAELFMVPQKADIMICSDEFYDASLAKYNNIDYIFLLTENDKTDYLGSSGVISIYKYSSVDMIYGQILTTSNLVVSNSNEPEKSKLILFYSATGGVGKTTLSMSTASCLAKQAKKVLYINASYLQTFQYYLENKETINDSNTYININQMRDNVYSVIKEKVRKEKFSYVPPFKAPLVSLGMDYSIFELMALSAKRSREYEYIIVDVEHSFNETNINLLNSADKVVFVLNQARESVEATKQLAKNINDISADKYIFVCNKFNMEDSNLLADLSGDLNFSVDAYVEPVAAVNINEMSESEAIKKISIFLMS